MDLQSLGWSPDRGTEFEAYRDHDTIPARVSEEHRTHYRVLTPAAELSATLSGRLRHETEKLGELPTVGDWVVITPRPAEGTATIHAVLGRHSVLVRKAPSGHKGPGGLVKSQVLAANLDTVFLVSALNRDFNPRRIERTLAVIWEGGAQPALLLNKADLVADIDEFRQAAETVAIGVPVFPVSALTGAGIDLLATYLEPGRTVAVIGSSGVGKSTLINRLVGEEIMTVREIREDDDRGRHTTTHRQMIALPEGGLLIDTPGLREVALWNAEEGIETTFADVELLAEQCRFRNCEHSTEPGCAVQAAIESGDLDRSRYKSYRKLQRELSFLNRQQDVQARLAERKRWKRITMANRRRYTHRTS